MGLSRHTLYLSLCAVVMLTLVSTTFAPSPGISATTPKTQLVVATTADAITLDPAFIDSTHERILSYYAFDYLLYRDALGKYGPWLADSYKQVNPTTWEFKLRKGVKFHDGTPFTAEDVKFTYERVMINPKNPNQGELVTFEDITVVDPYTVRFITKQFDAGFFFRIMKQPIVPSKYIKEKGDSYFGRHPIGTGPFVWKEWVKDDHVLYEANPNYWRGAPSVKRITFKPIPEYSTRAALLRTGEVDFIDDVVPDQAAQLAKESGIRIYSGPTLRSYMVILNTHRPPLDKKAVRQALNYAVDKEGIVKNIFRGYGVVGHGQILGPAQFGYDPNLKAYPYDPDKAKQLLTEAGYPNGFEATLLTPSGQFTLDKEMSEAIAGQLSKVGIKVKVQPVEYSVYTAQQNQGKFPEMAMIAFGASFEGGDALERAFASGEPFVSGLYWSNPEVDKLLKTYGSIVDRNAEEKALRKVEEIVRDDAPLIFLHYLVKIYAARDGVQFKPRPDLVVLFYKYPGNYDLFAQ